MKGVLIDPYVFKRDDGVIRWNGRKPVREVYLDTSLEAIYETLSTPRVQVQNFEILPFSDTEAIYIDEMPTTEDAIHHCFLCTANCHGLVLGRGLVLGVDDWGNSVDCETNVSEVEKTVLLYIYNTWVSVTGLQWGFKHDA